MKLTDEQIAYIFTTDYYDYFDIEPDRDGKDLVHIESVSFFDEVFDVKRKENGYLPLFDDSGEFDDEGWYNIYICVNVNTQKAEKIVAETECTQDDDDTLYEEEIEGEAQEKLYKRLVDWLGESKFYAYKEDNE